MHASPFLGSISAVFWLLCSAALAQTSLGAGALCRAAIETAETQQHIPDAFLSAIAKVESGRPIGGMVVPWPWTINAEGVGSFFASKEDAIAAVQALLARGVRSIDVGCMQVNLVQHPEAFHSLDQAFDPGANAHFAAGLLNALFAQMGSWPLAAAAYHSQTPTLGAAYQRQVLAAWATPDRPRKPAAKAEPAVRTADHATDPAPPASAAMSPNAISQPGAAFGRQVGALASAAPPKAALHFSGRSLSDYRQIPIRMAFRQPAKPS